MSAANCCPSRVASLQISPNGRLRHLITLDGLSYELLREIFADADVYQNGGDNRVLNGKLFINIFFESSTRTRVAFEATARQLGADVVNLDRITMAGQAKQESLEDTALTVAAMGAAGIALRHSESGAALRAAQAVDKFGMAVINGGTGCESHPTQGLTDAYTAREIIGDDFAAVKIAIVGDVLHSRVARSDIQAFRAMGAADIRLIGPPSLCPLSLSEELGAPVFNNIDEGLQDVDMVMMLRVQQERLQEEFNASKQDYHAHYGLDESRMKTLKKTAFIMHPGPINRGVEIAASVAYGARSKILRQVTNGMAIRKAILARLCA